jgi:hypothetical protein
VTSPAFNTPFDPYYDLYSISKLDFAVPDHFAIYPPEFVNSIDFQCLSVICPDPDLGAKQWTYRGRWITLGIYRDEGRETSQRPPTVDLTWTRSSTTLTITDPAGHRLRNGDFVDLYNINVPSLPRKPITVINANTFTVKVPLFGASSGALGAYQPSDKYNFYEQNIVFRLLPSFQLVPWSFVQQLFQDSAPDEFPQIRELFNITTQTVKQLPRGKSKSTNYDLPTTGRPIVETVPLARRFGQVYDEAGNPLKVFYRSDGQPVPLENFDEPKLDPNRAFNSPDVNPVPPDRVQVYDFYGLEINDVNRGPYFRTDLITRDLDKPAPINNIKRAEQNGVPYYRGKLYDRFMNLVIGIQENDMTVIRQNLLPLKLDRYNRPAKPPLRQTGRLQGF